MDKSTAQFPHGISDLIYFDTNIVIGIKGVSSASDSSRYTEPQLWILLHFHKDLKHTQTLSPQSCAGLRSQPEVV